MVSNQCVDCPSTIKLRSFAELFKQNRAECGFCKTVEQVPMFIEVEDLRVWVEKQKTEITNKGDTLSILISNDGTDQDFKYALEVAKIMGRIEFCEEMLEGLK